MFIPGFTYSSFKHDGTRPPSKYVAVQLYPWYKLAEPPEHRQLLQNFKSQCFSQSVDMIAQYTITKLLSLTSTQNTHKGKNNEMELLSSTKFEMSIDPNLLCATLLQETYVITLASSIKSSSDIEPSFIILTATVSFPRNVPSLTVCHETNIMINITNNHNNLKTFLLTPNCPVPNSLPRTISDRGTSHISVKMRKKKK